MLLYNEWLPDQPINGRYAAMCPERMGSRANKQGRKRRHIKNSESSTCEWWRAGPAAALPQQIPSAAAGKVLCGSLGGRCHNLAPPVTGTWDRRS